MANQITRKDIITDEAINWGQEYVKQVQPVINKNDELVKSILELNNANILLRASQDTKTYVLAQSNANKEANKTIGIWKEQIALENALISTKKKNELATESTNKALVKERLLLTETNKQVKEEVRNRLGMVTAYERLNKARLNAQKTLANLLSAEKQNNSEIVKAQFEFDKLDARVKAVDAATRNYSKNIGNYASAFKGLNQTAKDLLATFGAVTGLALFGTIVKDIFSTLKDFDRQLIAVGKTTNIEGQALKDFGSEVVALGDKLDGVSVEGLLKSAEVAGTLGVKGTDNILKFSTAIEKLKLTSDIISEEQVQNFAQFISVSQDSFENADRLASVMTVLGNNFATTEAKILSNATEIQKGVSIYNASAEGIIGLGAATSSLGSEAETSRSAIQSTFRVIDQAVSSGKNLEQVLKLTGLTQAQLSKQFNKDATGVFVKFVGGLSKAKEEGQNLNNILDGVEITEKRAVTVIGALAANYDTLTESVALANEEYKLNEALNNEVEDASKSISSILGDVKDKWDAYILSADQANGSTATIAKTLEFVRDNLKDIIDAFVKYGTVLLAYFGVMKLVNFVTSAFTALKVAAAAAELRFALATGIGRTSVLAQAAAVRTATVAQTGLNVAMTATPWGIIIAALAAVIVAYKVFNDELSENEKIQNRINANADRQRKSAEESAKLNEEFLNDRLKGVEDEYALKRKKQGESKKLDQEEIEAKKKVLNISIEANNEDLEANRRLLLQVRNNSDEKLKILEKESERLREIADKNSTYGNNIAAKRAQEEFANLKVDTANKKNNLIISNNQIIEETKKLNESLQELDKQNTLINAENQREETDKEKKAREAAYKKFLEAKKKALKEQYEADKKANDDAFKLSQFRLQKEIEINDLIIDNQKSSLDEKIDALEDSNKLLAQKNKEALEFELKQLGTYNEDSGKFIRQLSDIEIESLIETGKTKQKLTDEQQLIYEKYQRELTNNAKIQTDKRTKIIDSDVDAVLKLSNAQVQLQENTLNQETVAENNRYLEELKQAEDSYNKIQLARDKHEKKLLDIQNKYALEGTKIQIQALEKILSDNDAKEENEKISSEKRAEIVANLERYKREQSELTTGDYVQNLTKKTELEKENSERIKQLTSDLYSSLKDITNSLFDVRIGKIEEEQSYWDDYYNEQLELAGTDKEQKELIEAERDKKRKQLEKERRKEEYKAAVAQKIFAGIQIAIDLAKTLSAIQLAAAQMDALAAFGFGSVGLSYRGLQTGLAIGNAAAQAALIAASPLPKYEKGTKGKPHKGGPAWVGEKRPEVVIEPGKKPYIVDMPSVLNLAKGTEVIPSIGEYEALRRASIMASIQMKGKQMDNAKANVIFKDNYSKEIVDELRRNTEATKKNKGNIILNNKIDFGHQIWKMGNTKWN